MFTFEAVSRYFIFIHLSLFQRLELVRTAGTGNGKVWAVQRKQLKTAVHRVVVPETQHLRCNHITITRPCRELASQGLQN